MHSRYVDYAKRHLGQLLLACLLVIAGFASYFLSPYQAPALDAQYQVTDDTPSSAALFRAEYVRVIDKNTSYVKLIDGPRKGDTIRADTSYVIAPQPGAIVLINERQNGASSYDYWRLARVMIIVVAFLLLLLVTVRRRAVRSLAALAFAFVVIIYILLPLLLAGWPALLVCLGVAIVIAVGTLLIGYGVNRQTGIAIATIAVLLIGAAALAELAVRFAFLSGVADESSWSLGQFSSLDLRGILAGSILLVTLGVLDDVVLTQIAAVREIKQAGTYKTPKEVYARAMEIGNTHIVAVINTLALAYIGVTLPVFLSMLYYRQDMPVVSLLNSEFIAQEIVRTVVSSAALILAVPLATFLASKYLRVRSS